MKLTGDKNQCQSCREYFNSSHAFDKHRVGEHYGGNRRCLDESEMQEKGMVRKSDGFWVGSLMPKEVHK